MPACTISRGDSLGTDVKKEEFIPGYNRMHGAKPVSFNFSYGSSLIFRFKYMFGMTMVKDGGCLYFV